MTNVVQPGISIVILTFNRQHLVQKLVSHLAGLSYPNLEIIVVDNCSSPPVALDVETSHAVTILRMEQNIGIAGRNHGMRAATGDFIITLDDDVFGITDEDISHLLQRFADKDVAGICFKVVDEVSGQVIDWCHPYSIEVGANLSFETADISEGAVVYRKACLQQVGYYPEEYFISHEGPDLALRLIDAGYSVLYTPAVVVRHSRSTLGRPSWRRYYFDTRNTFWIAFRLYPLSFALTRMPISLAALFFYSIRDGFFRYYLKAIWDAVVGARPMFRQRTPLKKSTIAEVRRIENNKPSFFYLVKKRLFQTKIGI